MGDDVIVGATPLDPDEEHDLIPDHITSLQQLNDWEADNIARGAARAFARKRKDVLTEPFARTLHRWMFGGTWRWAGRYRQTGKNIGSPRERIPTEVRNVCDDTTFWVQNSTYSPDEIAVRLHHRMVSVHPFSNGNGRHARLLADVLLYQQDVPSLTWGRMELTRSGAAREEYLAALQEADAGDYQRLLALARK